MVLSCIRPHVGGLTMSIASPSRSRAWDDSVRIPGWVHDLASFRRWTLSDEFPQSGRIDYLGGDIWVDLTMEEFYGHNQVKGEYAFTIMSVSKASNLGRFIHDRMRLVHEGAELSCEPDGAFATWETLRTERLRLVPGESRGFMELAGTPDMVLEVISPSSVTKDTKELRERYWQAGITEYWLVDVRKETLRFEILVRGATGYVATTANEGWLKSLVFGKDFRLTQQTDPLGQPLFTLEVC